MSRWGWPAILLRTVGKQDLLAQDLLVFFWEMKQDDELYSRYISQLTHLLCISTSEWVLCTPFAGQNDLFLH